MHHASFTREVFLFNMIVLCVCVVLSDCPVRDSLFLHVVQDAGETDKSLEGACVDDRHTKQNIFQDKQPSP